MTDRRTDGRTDGQTDRKTDNYEKNNMSPPNGGFICHKRFAYNSCGNMLHLAYECLMDFTFHHTKYEVYVAKKLGIFLFLSEMYDRY